MSSHLVLRLMPVAASFSQYQITLGLSAEPTIHGAGSCSGTLATIVPCQAPPSRLDVVSRDLWSLSEIHGMRFPMPAGPSAQLPNFFTSLTPVKELTVEVKLRGIEEVRTLVRQVGWGGVWCTQRNWRTKLLQALISRYMRSLHIRWLRAKTKYQG